MYLLKAVLNGVTFVAATPYTNHAQMFLLAVKELLHLCDIVSRESEDNEIENRKSSACGSIIVQIERHSHRKWIFIY